MANTYRLQIITHEQIVFDGEVESLVAPGVMGYLGVWSHHAPLLTTLTEGVMTVRDAQEKTHRYQVKGGVLEVSRNVATVLTESLA